MKLCFFLIYVSNKLKLIKYWHIQKYKNKYKWQHNKITKLIWRWKKKLIQNLIQNINKNFEQYINYTKTMH